jgi:hypothetical protein
VEKKNKEGEIGCHTNSGSNKNPFKNHPYTNEQTTRVMTLVNEWRNNACPL